LKISTRCLAIFALLSLRMSSSVFPENMEPQITSIHPEGAVGVTEVSKNIRKESNIKNSKI
jgi:hypothetical protein